MEFPTPSSVIALAGVVIAGIVLVLRMVEAVTTRFAAVAIAIMVAVFITAVLRGKSVSEGVRAQYVARCDGKIDGGSYGTNTIFPMQCSGMAPKSSVEARFNGSARIPTGVKPQSAITRLILLAPPFDPENPGCQSKESCYGEHGNKPSWTAVHLSRVGMTDESGYVKFGLLLRKCDGQPDGRESLDLNCAVDGTWEIASKGGNQ